MESLLPKNFKGRQIHENNYFAAQKNDNDSINYFQDNQNELHGNHCKWLTCTKVPASYECTCMKSWLKVGFYLYRAVHILKKYLSDYYCTAATHDTHARPHEYYATHSHRRHMKLNAKWNKFGGPALNGNVGGEWWCLFQGRMWTSRITYGWYSRVAKIEEYKWNEENITNMFDAAPRRTSSPWDMPPQ